MCVANDAYAQHAAVMLASLFETTPNIPFNVYLLTDGISKNNASKLGSHCRRYGNLLKIIDCNLVSLGLQGLNYSNWNLIIYLKLFIANLLPSTADRCLFLDVDMIVNHNIKELYESDLCGSIIAGCQDTPVAESKRKKLGLSMDDIFINSGVMIMDLKKWRDSNLDNVSIFLKRNKSILTNDQDAIALLFKGNIKILATNKWNATTFFFHQTPNVQPKFYDEIEAIRKDPWIIHFCFPVKPWFRECKHPYRKLYDKYRYLTPYKNIPKQRFFNLTTAIKYNLKYWLTRYGLIKWKYFEVPVKTR